MPRQSVTKQIFAKWEKKSRWMREKYFFSHVCTHHAYEKMMRPSSHTQKISFFLFRLSIQNSLCDPESERDLSFDLGCVWEKVFVRSQRTGCEESDLGGKWFSKEFLQFSQKTATIFSENDISFRDFQIGIKRKQKVSLKVTHIWLQDKWSKLKLFFKMHQRSGKLISTKSRPNANITEMSIQEGHQFSSILFPSSFVL